MEWILSTLYVLYNSELIDFSRILSNDYARDDEINS